MAVLKIKLAHNERTISFKTKRELEVFFEEEQSFWNGFFDDCIAKSEIFNPLIQRIKNNLFLQFGQFSRIMDDISSNFENVEEYKSSLENYYTSKLLIYSQCAYTKFVLKEENLILSVFLVGVYLENGLKDIFFDQYGRIVYPGLSNSISSLISEASAKKIYFETGKISNINAEKEALTNIKEEFGDLISQGDDHLNNIQKSYQEEKESIQHRQQRARQQVRINIKRFRKFMQISKQNMKGFEDFYEKKLAMDSAVKYWTDQKIKSYKISGILFVVIIIASIFGIKYLFGISETIGHNLLDINNTQIKNTSLNAIHYLPILHFAIISTFLIWFMRIIVKIFLSKLHSAEVAGEREMFIKSYLALLNEHKDSIVDENDRQLILQSIFRPSNDGFITEEGPKITDIINLVSKSRVS